MRRHCGVPALVLAVTALVGAQTAAPLHAVRTNPYGFVGRLHNQALDRVAQNLDRFGEDRFFWAPAAAGLVAESVCDQGRGRAERACVAGGTGYASAVLVRVRPLLTSDAAAQERAIARMLDGLDLSAAQRRLLESIFEALPEDPSRAADTYAALDRIDAETMETLPRSQARIVFIASAVARESTAYWAAQAGSGSSPWFGGDLPPAGLCWKCIGAADVGGAIFGGVGAAVFGGIGVVGGAVLGGGIASAGWLLVEIFK